MDGEESATLPCAALTAWNALLETGPKLTPGATILTLGSGGVSIFAMQFARAAGFEVLSTTSSDAKGQKLSSLGARDVINYRTNPDWEKEVARLSRGLGVDHVIEVGGAGTLPKSMAAVRFGGAVSLIGILSGRDGQVNALPILLKSVRVQGIYVVSVAMFESMNAMIEQVKIRPVIEKVYEFDEAVTALRDFESARHIGKIVIRVA
jgi:NADPH:quinone reductase-like Zn-dependent oxidoreductase